MSIPAPRPITRLATLPWISSACGLTVKNTGNSVCSINGDPLDPGESKGFAPPWAALLVGRYAIKFSTPATTPPGYVQADSSVVTEMFYLPYNSTKQSCR
jgi:hypothetical protein